MEPGWPKYTPASVWQALLLSTEPITTNLITAGMNTSWGLAPAGRKASGGSWEVQHSWFLISAATNLQCHTRYLLCLWAPAFSYDRRASFAWGCPEALMGIFVCKPFRPEDGPRQTFLSKASITAAGTWRQCQSTRRNGNENKAVQCDSRTKRGLTDCTISPLMGKWWGKGLCRRACYSPEGGTPPNFEEVQYTKLKVTVKLITVAQNMNALSDEFDMNFSKNLRRLMISNTLDPVTEPQN